ncbi:gamma-tubulin complex component 6 isoform X2 [Fopius arisanus]|uniref:Gamma-tubulin complex component 6 isoform X2 n=1 Tax=Fopius arisanus TaxID=64838 RepID=A0A9R1TFP6_9HYME|nr:PREDICTED: gamma-tubulin complex component 6 isoform X2 [Fopius arisanus]
MDSRADSWDFYGLVTDLCRGVLKDGPFDNYANKREKIIKKMRTRAFEVLLRNPTGTDNQQKDVRDPLAELLKHSFVLRCSFGHASRAAKLDEALEELQESEELDGPLDRVLQFLYWMKAYEIPETNDLNIFHFGEQNPVLPEPRVSKRIPEYQTYPSSAFHLPYNITTPSNSLLRFSDLPMDPPFSLPPGHLELSRLSEFIPSTPMLMSSCYLVQEDPSDPPFWDHMSPTPSSPIPSHPPVTQSILNIPWTSPSPLEPTRVRTWESLGNPSPPNPSTFILESETALYHLQNFRHWSFYPENSADSPKTPDINLSTRQFLENVKLVLLGIESDVFIWNTKLGFIFKSNTTVPLLSNESLKDICFEITHWATCFKLLSLLIRPGPDSNGKLREDGLIFKAMCTNIDEILIHYQAVILQVFGEDFPQLLTLLHQLGPIGCLISEVARLCRCDNVRRTIIGEGIGLLSHIYKEVTRITKPNIALVYYSVLKSCCEVYFEYLEKWIFEGRCDETHGEFMINIRIQYLRTRGHKFWSKCYGINKESVPGFLKDLTDSILQCGKAVRLLKICDPKNPMCNLFFSAHPLVKVCLNVNMLSEQEEICQEYMSRGIELLGNVTLSSALQQMRVREKCKADVVMAAQAGALQRIKKSQEEARLLVAKNKRELLANLKNQAEEAVSRRERAREAKILEEKLEMEKHAAEEEEEKKVLMAEAKVTADYYKELAEEARRRKLRAVWRGKRMALFEERVEMIIAARHEESQDDGTADEGNQDDNNELPSLPAASDRIDEKDENSNDSTSDSASQKTILSGQDSSTRTPRPRDLSLKEKTSSNDSKSTEMTLESMTTEAILVEISQSNRLFKERRTVIISGDDSVNTAEESREDGVVLDKEGNERTGGTTRVNLNINLGIKEDDPVDKIDTLVGDESRKEVVDNQLVMSQVGINDVNDVTPMSCTTDSYHQSVSSSLFYNCLEVGSLAGSKNDLETPLSPEEHLPKSDKQNLPESQSFFSGFGLDNGPVNFESSLTMADVELIDNTSLQIYLEKSVMIPLMVQSKLANSAVIKYLLEEHKILSHFQSLRSFFFLLNGEFARNLTGSVFRKFYEISVPVELFNSATLTNLLENALHSSLNYSYENAELLSLSAIDTPSLLTVSDPEALDCLCLHYKVSWPLNVIIDEVLMQQYSKVFKFLMMVGRVLWVLQEDFCILKVEREAALSPQYHRLQLFRHAMMQFMIAFSNYLTCSVLHASWTEFEKELESATSLDEIYTTHVSYIKKILSRCMLTSKAEKLRQCLCNIFKIILKFHNCLRSHEWHKGANGYTISNYNKLEQMYEAFCDLRTYPAHVVEKLASSGYQSHLTHFLDSLNINPLYNLSTKGV